MKNQFKLAQLYLALSPRARPLTASDPVEVVVCGPDAVGILSPGVTAGRKGDDGCNNGRIEMHVERMLDRLIIPEYWNPWAVSRGVGGPIPLAGLWPAREAAAADLETYRGASSNHAGIHEDGTGDLCPEREAIDVEFLHPLSLDQR